MINFTDICEVVCEATMSPELQAAKKAKERAAMHLYNAKKRGLTGARLQQYIDADNQARAAYEAAKRGDVIGSNKPAQPTDYTSDPDYKEGYDAAVQAMKEAQDKQDQGDQDKQDQQGGQGSSGSRDDSSDGSGNQGIVRPEDCCPPDNGLQDVPNTPGSMINKEDGDKLAKSEGYDPAPGSADSISKEWTERARKAASKMAGKGAGWDKLANKINDLTANTQDWKKELKNIIGRSISPEDKRQAYANKNALVSQSRIARTDKDQYNNMDYMIAFIDTSGSMTKEYLEQCLREIYVIAQAKKPIRLVVARFDTRITDIKEYTNIRDLTRDIKSYQLKGGGGTECWCCWELLKNDKRFRGKRADIAVIFTDGYLQQYKRDPRSMNNLLWVVTNNTGFALSKPDACTKCLRIKIGE